MKPFRSPDSRSPCLRMAGWILLASCAACSRSPFALANVSGKVLLDGQPLTGGVINFQPIASGTDTNGGPGSTARIGPEGRFTLATIRGAPGAVVGMHRVKIYSFSPESPATADRGSPAERERVPAAFNYKSHLTFDVPAAGTESADFLITTK